MLKEKPLQLLLLQLCVCTQGSYREQTNHFRNECEYGCPEHTHCEWGFCECDPGYVKAWGICRLVRKEPIKRTEEPPKKLKIIRKNEFGNVQSCKK